MKIQWIITIFCLGWLWGAIWVALVNKWFKKKKPVEEQYDLKKP